MDTASITTQRPWHKSWPNFYEVKMLKTSQSKEGFKVINFTPKTCVISAIMFKPRYWEDITKKLGKDKNTSTITLQLNESQNHWECSNSTMFDK